MDKVPGDRPRRRIRRPELLAVPVALTLLHRVAQPDWAGWPKATRAESIRWRSLEIVPRYERPMVVSVSRGRAVPNGVDSCCWRNPPGAAHADGPPIPSRTGR